MKIALIHRYYPMPGGVTTVVKYLKEELSKNNDVTLITNDPTCKEKNTIFLSGKDFSFYWRAYKYIKKNDFDIAHTQSFPFCYFAPFLKTPIIMSVQGYDKIYDWPKSFLIKIKVILTTIGRGLAYRFVDKIIAISNVVKNNIVNRWKINKNKVSTILNGVDSNTFRPMPAKRNDKNFRVFIYSTSKRKGFDKLLTWMPELIKNIPSIKIVVAGGKMDLDEELSPYFDFLGQVDFKKMPKVFNSVDLVLLPSIDEPFGITAAEGMACGKPVIVSDLSGVMDVIDGKNGVISSFENFPKNIIYLYKNKNLCKRMGLLAREAAKSKLSSEYLSAQHIKLYKSLININ